MRIALDVTCAAKKELSGIGRYAEQLVRALARVNRGHDHDFDLLYRVSRPKRLRYRLPLPDARFRNRMFLEPFGGLLLARTAVVHGLDARVPRTARARRVATLHDVFSAIRDDLASDEFRTKKKASYRMLAEQADVIVAVSEGTRRDFLSLYPQAQDRVVVVHHGVDAAFAPRSAEEVAAVRARLALPERYLFFAGLLSTRKNCVRMIEAFDRIARAHPDLHFVLAGAPSHGFAEIAAAHERSRARDRIHRPGFVAAEDLPALYSGARALVFATLYEGFGLPILEAHACGCPVVASDQVTPREVGGDLAFYADPADADAIAAAIERALASRLDPTLAARRLAAAASFTWDRTAEQMLAIYESGANAAGTGIRHSLGAR